MSSGRVFARPRGPRRSSRASLPAAHRGPRRQVAAGRAHDGGAPELGSGAAARPSVSTRWRSSTSGRGSRSFSAVTMFAFQERQLLHPGCARDGDDERPAAQTHRLGTTGDRRPDGVVPDPPDGGRAGGSEHAIQTGFEDRIDARGLTAGAHLPLLSLRGAMEKALRLAVIFLDTVSIPCVLTHPALQHLDGPWVEAGYLQGALRAAGSPENEGGGMENGVAVGGMDGVAEAQLAALGTPGASGVEPAWPGGLEGRPEGRRWRGHQSLLHPGRLGPVRQRRVGAPERGHLWGEGRGRFRAARRRDAEAVDAARDQRRRLEVLPRSARHPATRDERPPADRARRRHDSLVGHRPGLLRDPGRCRDLRRRAHASAAPSEGLLQQPGVVQRRRRIEAAMQRLLHPLGRRHDGLDPRLVPSRRHHLQRRLRIGREPFEAALVEGAAGGWRHRRRDRSPS